MAGRNNTASGDAVALILESAQAWVRDSNVSYFACYCTNARVRIPTKEELKGLPTLDYNRESSYRMSRRYCGAVTWLTVTHRMHPGQRIQTVPVRCEKFRGQNHRFIDAPIEVKYNGKWTRFYEWLHDTAPTPLLGRLGFDLLMRWWKINRYSIKLFDLPAEIRNALYKACVGQHIHPDVVERKKPSRDGSSDPESLSVLELGHGWQDHANDYGCRQKLSKALVDWQPGYIGSIIYASKRTHSEYMAWAWESATKSFDEPGRLLRAVPAMQVSPYNCLNKIQLNMSMFGYMNTFGMDLDGVSLDYDYSTQLVPATVFASTSMPNLKSLELWFSSTMVLPYSDPWSRQSVCDPDSPFSCQKVLVDWILLFAYDYIKHIGEIKLTGYIKNETRFKWLDIYGGSSSVTQHDITTRIGQIRSKPAASFPPACHCWPSCDPNTAIDSQFVRDPEGLRWALMMKYEFHYEDQVEPVADDAPYPCYPDTAIHYEEESDDDDSDVGSGKYINEDSEVSDDESEEDSEHTANEKTNEFTKDSSEDGGACQNAGTGKATDEVKGDAKEDVKGGVISESFD